MRHPPRKIPALMRKAGQLRKQRKAPARWK
nr:MAG TPA: hypothetical protein [Caudoviricetes sp.]